MEPPIDIFATSIFNAQLQEIILDPSKIKAANRRALERIINDPQKSREAFENIRTEDIVSEGALLGFLESAHIIFLDESGSEKLSNRYFNLLSHFIEKFNLRYDLRRSCILCPTLPGVYTNLVRELQAATAQDNHLDQLMKDFEESVRDLRFGCSDQRIKTCIQKQINLIEAMGGVAAGCTNPNTRREALSKYTRQIGSWPHKNVRRSLENLYGFTCDYPGIRHGGTPGNAIRAIDMRDMVAISIILTGFTPYLCNGLNPVGIYGGGSTYRGPIPTFTPVPAAITAPPSNNLQLFLNSIWMRIQDYFEDIRT